MTLANATISAAVAIVVATITSAATIYLQKDRLAAELRNRLQSDLRTEFMAEQAIQHLLEHRKWELRSYDQIKARIGGFEDDELRRLLVRAGALRFKGKDGGELWGLRSRNSERLNS